MIMENNMQWQKFTLKFHKNEFANKAIRVELMQKFKRNESTHI